MVAPVPLTTIPFQVWLLFVIIGMLCMVYGLLRRDMNDYTHIVGLAFSVILYFICGFYCFMGLVVTSGSTTTTFKAAWMALMFFACGVYIGILTFMRIVDLTKVSNYTDGSTTSLDPVKAIRKI